MMKNLSKSLKKTLALILCCIFFLSTVIMSVHAQPSYTFKTETVSGLVPAKEIIFSENFNASVSLSNGSTWGSEGKTLTLENNTNAEIESSLLYLPGESSSTNTLSLKTANPIEGKYTTEFKFKLIGQAATKRLFAATYFDGETEKVAVEIDTDAFTSDTTRFYRNLNYYDNSGNKNPLVDLTSSWRTLIDFHKWFILHGDSPSWATYSTDWYVMKVVLDTESEKYSVYLNGSLCVKDQPFVDEASHDFSASGINVPFTLSAQSAGVKYDDILVYREPVGRTTFYANDFNSYKTETSWVGTTSYATQRRSLFAGVAGLGLANAQNKGGTIYARNNALVTEYRDGKGGAFAGIIRMDDDMTIDMDFKVDSFVEDSYVDNYATVIALTPVGADGIRFSVSKDGKFIYYYYNRTIPYEPTILTNISMNETHHLTLYMNFETYTCDLYIDGVLVQSKMNLMYNMGKKGTSGYYKNGEDMTIALGYHKESPTTNVTYDNMMVYRDNREEVLSETAVDLFSRFNGSTLVKGSVELPSGSNKYSYYNIKWKSDSPAITIDANGHSATVTPTEEEQVVKLTATVTDDENQLSTTRSYNVVVVADDSITDISALTDWTTVKGSPLLIENPTAESDKSILIPANAEAYRTSTAVDGIVQASTDIYLSNSDKCGIYLADSNGNKFMSLKFDAYNIFASISKTDFESFKCKYPTKKWFNVKVIANMLSRTYDIYIDDMKVNNSSISFDPQGNVEDNALLSRIGFEGFEGKVYVDNVISSKLSDNAGLVVTKINYADENGKDVKIPKAGGCVKSVDISNTSDVSATEVFVALYNKNGKLLSIGNKKVNSMKTGLNRVNFTGVNIPDSWTNDCVATAKAFVWKDAASLKPLTDAHGKIETPTVYVIGDSAAASYPTEQYPYEGWGSELGSLLNSTGLNYINMAQIDCNSSEFVLTYLDKVSNHILPGDYVFISAATDDARDSIAQNTYKENLRLMIAMAKSNGANVVLVTSPSSNTLSVDAYATSMKEVAQEESVIVLDLNSEWNNFLGETTNDSCYFAKSVTSEMKSDYRWELSSLNSSNINYDVNLVGKEGILSGAGAQKAADIVARLIKNSNIDIASKVIDKSEFTYTVSNNTLTVSGNGDMPIYGTFTKTPWANETGITTIKINEGVTSVCTDAFTGFNSVTNIYLPESLEVIHSNAFPTSNVTLWGYNNSVAQRYAENDANVKFALSKLRIFAIGNSHTHDYMYWRDLIFADLKDAGLKTEIEFDYAIVGGAQLYAKDILYVGTDAEYRSHYQQGSNPNRPYYNIYTKLRDNTYDLVLVQDYRESVMDKYRYTFPENLAKVVRWVRDEQPNADVAWVSDWTDMNSTGNRGTLISQWKANSVSIMNSIETSTDDKPDFIVPMSTAITNARTSYLGSVYNAADCYGDNSNTDWNGTKGIDKFTILERDGTHCSYELGRYLVCVTVFGKIFNVYKESLAGAESINFYNILSRRPEFVTNSIYPWNGELTDNHVALICEAAQNALTTPMEVTQSTYTTDPADAIAASVENLSYPTFTQEGIAQVVNAANLGITVTASDIIVGESTAQITFLHGYTKKTVTVNK